MILLTYFQAATRNLTLVCSYVCLAKSRMRSKVVVLGRRYNFIPHLPKKGGITNLSTKTHCGRFDKVLFSWYIVCTYTLQNCFGKYVGGCFLTHKIFDAQNFNARILLHGLAFDAECNVACCIVFLSIENLAKFWFYCHMQDGLDTYVPIISI